MHYLKLPCLALVVVFGLAELVKLREMKMCSYCAPLLNILNEIQVHFNSHILTYTHTHIHTLGLCGV